MKTLEIARRERRICKNCGDPPELERGRCATCLQNATEQAWRVRQRRKESGVCVRCGRHEVLPGLEAKAERLCEPCYLKKVCRFNFGTSLHWQRLAEKLVVQQGRCAYTGESLILGVNDSLDHIKPISRFPELRGDPENTEWVCRSVNEMKRDRTPEEFLCLIRQILAHRE
jgi:hypothetical protein